jgi:hypothetical protein
VVATPLTSKTNQEFLRVIQRANIN